MTLRDRAEAYNSSSWGQRYPASQLQVVREQDRDVLYGRWVMGQNYRRTSELYGAYPPHYLERVGELFPDVGGEGRTYEVLHAFSGSLPEGDYVRCDMRAEMKAEYVCRIEDLHLQWPYSQPGHVHSLVFADPPYSDADAKRYGTPMIERRKVLGALAGLTKPSGHVCWLDCVWPMHRKDQWRTVGRIAITRSTNHRVRDLTIFERVA